MKITQLVEGDHDLIISKRELREFPKDLPIEVRGRLSCHSNRLRSLDGCPQKIGGDFDCTQNLITSLDHGPTEVGGSYYINENRLSSLENIHTNLKSVGRNFECYRNQITSHILGLMLINIGGNINTWLGDGDDVDRVLNKWKNQGRRGVMGAMKELLELGYEDLAKI